MPLPRRERAEVEVVSNVIDTGDGKYVLSWRCKQSGVFRAQVTIQGEAVVGSPFPIHFQAGRPVLSMTSCKGEGLKEVQVWGRSVEARCTAGPLDSPAVPSRLALSSPARVSAPSADRPTDEPGWQTS